MPVTPTALGETVVAGDDYVATATLTKDSATYNLTGHTVTSSVRSADGKNNNNLDHAVTITNAVSGICTLTLSDTETAALLAAETRPDYLALHPFIGDFKVVEAGGDVVHAGPFSFDLRRPIT